MEVWILAQVKGVDASGWATDWDLGGVFSSEEKARERCVGPGDCIWSVSLDQFLGFETISPPGLTYPNDPREVGDGTR